LRWELGGPGLPFNWTDGFNPRRRVVFALSLALGIVGRDEVLELELDAELPPEEIHERLARQAPAGLEIHSVRRLPPKARARVRRVVYRVAVPPRDDLPGRVAALLAAADCRVERTRPQPRRFNLRPYLRDLRLTETTESPSPPHAGARGRGEGAWTALTPSPPAPRPLSTEGEGGLALDIDLWVTPQGMARPEEGLRLLGLDDPLDPG